MTFIPTQQPEYRDIAILVSMGAKQAQIRRIFMFQGVLIGVVGTAIGLAAGHLLCFFADKYRWIRLDEEVYALSFVPFSPRWVDSVWIAALAILISFVATIYPARNASRITPARRSRARIPSEGSRRANTQGRRRRSELSRLSSARASGRLEQTS